MKKALAELASEYWKLLRAFDRAIALAPEDAKLRLTAQGRYAAGKLDAILQAEKLRIISFEGQRFEVNLPAIAVNGDEVQNPDHAIVERTLEPAVVSDDGVILTGKVYLSSAS